MGLLSFLVALTLSWRNVTPGKIKIGAILTEKDVHLIETLKFVRNDLQKAFMIDLQYEAKTMKKYDITTFLNHYCALLNSGASVIFGSTDTKFAAEMALLSEKSGLPFFNYDTTGFPRTRYPPKSTVNYFSEEDFVVAIKDMIVHWKWKEVVWVYSEEYRVARFGAIWQCETLAHVDFKLIQIRNDDFLKVAKQLKQLDNCPFSYATLMNYGCQRQTIIMDLTPDHLREMMYAALQVGLVNDRHVFLITTLDMNFMNMEPFKHNRAQFVALDSFQHINESTDFVSAIENAWRLHNPRANFTPISEAVFFHDSLLHFVLNFPYRNRTSRKKMCTRYAKTGVHFHFLDDYPAKVFQSLTSVNFTGLSGRLIVNDDGFRTNQTFQIRQLNRNGTIGHIGYWEPHNKYTLQVPELLEKEEGHLELRESKPLLRVITKFPPYVMNKSNGEPPYKGFCIDLLYDMAKELEFDIQIIVAEDGRYGEINETGHYDGMIGELLNGNADIAIGDITINYERAQVVDFTVPFLHFGISILYKIPASAKPSLFSFMNPLSMDIWLFLVISILTVPLVICVVARVTPYEWHPTKPKCVVGKPIKPPFPKRYELFNNFDLANSIWYVITTLMKGGCSFAPKAVSTRLLGGMWWVFTLILTSAYTANLAAFLTIEKRYIPIKNMDELANQTAVKYGTLMGGTTMKFFQESKIPTHIKMWAFMNKSAQNFVPNYDAGVAKVINEPFALLMESSSVEYYLSQDCNLTQIGNILGSQGYGIVLKKGSPWTSKLSTKILALAENGHINYLKRKYWENNNNCIGGGANVGYKQSRVAFNMENVAGLFLILIAGMGLALVLAFLEFCIQSKKNAKEDQQSFCSELWQELSFAVRVRNSNKKHRMKSRCSRCESSPQPTAKGDNPSYVPSPRPDDAQDGLLQPQYKNGEPDNRRMAVTHL